MLPSVCVDILFSVMVSSCGSGVVLCLFSSLVMIWLDRES